MTSKDALTRAGLNLIQQALTIYDSGLRLAVCNRRFAEMFDLPDSLTTPGAGFEETIRHLATRGEYGDIDDLEDFIHARVRTALAFEPHYMERTRANGRTISVEGAPLPQGGWVTVYTDITAMKEQEQLLRTRSELLSEEVLHRSEELAATNRQLAATISALEEAQRELREIEARTRLTTEMMPAHIAHVDSAGRYTYSNRRLNAVMPGRPSDILGMHIGDALGASAYARVLPHLQQALAGQQSTFEFTDETSSRRIRVAFTPDEAERGVYILSMDVTEETQARVALQQTRRREIAAQLTSGLAHDFSNLLTIILGTQSRLERMGLGDEAGALIAATRSAAQRGGELLDRIAGMTGPRSYRPDYVRLDELLSGLESLARPALPEALRLSVANTVETPVLLDAGLLQDSLLNVVLNARDACGATGAIRIEARAVMDTWLEFCISDSGPGFSEEALRRGLDPFFTTKGASGSGLGLAMVYDSTKLAGGEVRLSNGPRGAVVTLRLPLRTVPERPDPQLVLLVEDDPDLRSGIRAMLTGLGHAVAEASRVDEALSLLDSVPGISLVLSDILLEGADTGIDLARHVDGPRLVLMTSLPETDARCRSARALAPLLRKPFTEAQLGAVLGVPGEPA